MGTLVAIFQRRILGPREGKGLALVPQSVRGEARTRSQSPIDCFSQTTPTPWPLEGYQAEMPKLGSYVPAPARRSQDASSTLPSLHILPPHAAPQLYLGQGPGLGEGMGRRVECQPPLPSRELLFLFEHC